MKKTTLITLAILMASLSQAADKTLMQCETTDSEKISLTESGNHFFLRYGNKTVTNPKAQVLNNQGTWIDGGSMQTYISITLQEGNVKYSLSAEQYHGPEGTSLPDWKLVIENKKSNIVKECSNKGYADNIFNNIKLMDSLKSPTY